jgi:hypothetical protein
MGIGIYIIFVVINFIIAYNALKHGAEEDKKFFEENNGLLFTIATAFVMASYVGTIVALLFLIYSLISINNRG